MTVTASDRISGRVGVFGLRGDMAFWPCSGVATGSGTGLGQVYGSGPGGNKGQARAGQPWDGVAPSGSARQRCVPFSPANDLSYEIVTL